MASDDWYMPYQPKVQKGLPAELACLIKKSLDDPNDHLGFLGGLSGSWRRQI